MKTNVLAKDDKREVFRLTDMVVREVSIVDRPANLRPFLIMKNEGGQGAELEPDGMGGFRLKAVPSETEKPVEAAPVEPPPVEKQAPPALEIDDATVSAALAPLDMSVVEKVGRKLAAKREQSIRQAIELLLAVLDDTTKSVEAMTASNKALTTKAAQAEAELAALQQKYESLEAQHVAVVRAVNKARGIVQKSNNLHSEESRDSGTGAVVWPSDLNS